MFCVCVLWGFASIRLRFSTKLILSVWYVLSQLRTTEKFWFWHGCVKLRHADGGVGYVRCHDIVNRRRRRRSPAAAIVFVFPGDEDDDGKRRRDGKYDERSRCAKRSLLLRYLWSILSLDVDTCHRDARANDDEARTRRSATTQQPTKQSMCDEMRKGARRNDEARRDKTTRQ